MLRPHGAIVDSNEGGTSDRLIMFPDETARYHFAEAGWSPLVNANTTETPADA